MKSGWSASARRGLVLAVLAAAGTAACAAPHRPWLVVEDVTHERVLYRASVEPGSLLVLSYLHSSEHVPVRGTFAIGGDGMLLAKETAFAGFGPGLPEPTAGDRWRLEAGMIVVPASDRFPALLVRVSPLTRHRLRTPLGEDLDLSAQIPGGGAARIRLQR